MRKVEGALHYVTIDDPRQPNDGDVEVILDADYFNVSNSDDEQRTKYTLPEETIKLSFLEKAAKLRASVEEQEEELRHQTNQSVHESNQSYSAITRDEAVTVKKF